MSRNKRGSAADDIYESHIFGENIYKRNTSVNREQAIYRMMSKWITEIATNRFKWFNLPSEIDERFMELCLFYNGLSVFYFDDEIDKFVAARGSGMGYVNMLDNPVNFVVVGPNAGIGDTVNTLGMMNKTVIAFDPPRHLGRTADELKSLACPIWSNNLRYPDWDIVQIYASRLAWMDRTIEINSKNARRNKVIATTQNTQLSAVNMVRGIDQGEELIQITGGLGDELNALDLGITPDSYEKLHILRTRTLNECMSMLGINAANQDKKERLVAAEVNANDEQINSALNISLNARKLACERINLAFGLNVSVEYNIDVEQMAKSFAMNQLGIDGEAE